MISRRDMLKRSGAAIGGIRYCSGALRARPRTEFTHAHTIQPRKER